MNKVTKDHDLNVRAYRLTRTEQLLVLSVISLIHPDDEDFKTYQLSIKEFMKLIEIETKTKYQSLPAITKGLMGKVIEIREENHDLLQCTWLSSVRYKKGTGIIEVKLSPELKPHLLKLQDGFVSYALKNVAKLSSKYSIRIYELLRQNDYKYQKCIKLELGEFRNMIGIPDGVNEKYGSLKQKVIIPAQKEINNQTDISFEFEEIKVGRKIVELKFNIRKKNVKTEGKEINNNEIKPEENRNLNEPIKSKTGEVSKVPDGDNRDKEENLLESKLEPLRAIMNKSMSDMEINKIYEIGKGDIDNILEVYLYAKNKEVDNLVGYMLSLLKNGFNKPIGNIPKPSKDFDERGYDYDELEMKLLGWDKLK